MISISSVVCALAVYTIVLFVVCLASLWPKFIKMGGAFILLLMSAVATLRLLLPFELPLTRLIRSWGLMGGLVHILRTYPDLTAFLLAVWVAGGIVFVCFDARTLHRAYEMSSGYVPVDDDRVEEIVARRSIPYRVVVSPYVDVPYVEGIFRHTIYLPVLGLSDRDIEFALIHEVQHIRNHDSVIKFFFRVLLAVMWWDPVAHWFWYRLDDFLEMRCDAKLTKHMCKREREDYVEALKNMARELVLQKPMSPLAVDEFLVSSRAEFLKLRVDIILDGTGIPRRGASVVAGCFLAALFCASYLVIVQPAVMPQEEGFEEKQDVSYYGSYDGVYIDEEGSYALIMKGIDGRYRLYIDFEFSRYLSEDEIASEQYQNTAILEESE